MDITNEILNRAAELSMIEIRDEEREPLCRDLQKILRCLAAINVDGNVKDALGTQEETAPLRDDIPIVSMDRDMLLSNGTDAGEGYFRVPQTVN